MKNKKQLLSEEVKQLQKIAGIKKEEPSDWEPGFEWMDELPMKYGNWTIDTVEDSVGFGFDDQPIVWYYKGDENGYRVVYTPNDYYATEIMLYTPGQNMYDSDEKPIELQSIELGDETEDFSLVHFGADTQARPGDFVKVVITDASAHYLLADAISVHPTRGGDAHFARTAPGSTTLGMPKVRA